MRSLRIILLPLLVGALAATAASAQSQSLSSRAVADINAATLVRVSLVRGAQRHPAQAAGRLDEPALRAEPHARRGGSVVELAAPLAVADVLEIERPVGTNAGKGARIGAGIGAALSLLAVVVTASSTDYYYKPSAGQYVAAVGIWTLLGAGIGSLIGNGSKKWETVYRQP